ncbi:MAG TPA: type II CAAX endopeptidase family protein [Acidimicrobiia bacterium]|nr:type II CAAX endopeptidase family protein [Acidimicrobiia bacterium]
MIGDPEALDETYLPDAQWTATDAFLVFFVGLVGSVIGVAFATVAGAADFGLVAAGLGAQAVAALGLAAYLSSRRGTGDWERDFGLRIEPRHVGWLAAGLALQLAVALLVGPIIELFAPEDAPQQGIADVAEDLDGSVNTLVFLFLVVIVAPLVEELIFRGMLLSRLRRSMGKWGAVTMSAAVFAAIHLIDPNAVFAVPGLFLIGLALGWAALRYGNLSVPIFLHAGVNLTGAIVLLYSDELLESVDALSGLLL